MPRVRATSRKKSNSKKKRLRLCFSGVAILLVYIALVANVLTSRSSELVDSKELSGVTQTAQDRAYTKDTLLVNSAKKIPLESVLQGWNITGDVNWLLDFAIVGFPKTGTSTLMLYLEKHSDSIFIPNEERCEFGWKQHVKLIRELYRHYQPGRRIGIKCPRDLEIDLSLETYHQFFPATKFLVGLRHPILWFESFYNFRVTNEYSMPPAQKLVGKCRRFNQGVCTDRANFMTHLSKIEVTRPVFLYNVAQLKDDDSNRSRYFLEDLGDFLQISKPLDKSMIWVKPGQKVSSDEKTKEINALKINICEDEYASLRQVLLDHASNAATWMKEVFLAQENVHVSSQKYFRELLEEWYNDPCEISR